MSCACNQCTAIMVLLSRPSSNFHLRLICAILDIFHSNNATRFCPCECITLLIDSYINTLKLVCHIMKFNSLQLRPKFTEIVLNMEHLPRMIMTKGMPCSLVSKSCMFFCCNKTFGTRPWIRLPTYNFYVNVTNMLTK